MIAAGLAAVPVGVWLLRHADGAVYALGLGVFLSAYGGTWRSGAMPRARGQRVDRCRCRRARRPDGGLAGLPGPSVTIWCSMRGWDTLTQRATYQPFILVMQVACVICLHLQDVTATFALDDLGFVAFAMIGESPGSRCTSASRSGEFHVVTSTLLVASGTRVAGAGALGIPKPASGSALREHPVRCASRMQQTLE
jgi:uncharacterized membrane protein YfcA